MAGKINFSTAEKQGHFEMTMGPAPKAMMGVIVTCALMGLFVISSRVYSFMRLIFSLFVLPGKPLRSFGPKGSWAIVTGASDGIGREFALQLASKGFNILLVSRTQSKLDAVAQEVMHMNGAVRAETLAIDFVQNQDSDFDAFGSAIAGKDVAMLINSAGVSHDIPVSFAETPRAEVNAIIATNCTGTLRITQLVLPAMIKRKKGLVLTMGSFAGLIPTPLLASYSGSKAFLQHWSSALGAELAPHGITVELVQSYLVTSAMSKVRKPSLLVPNARNYAKAVLGKIGRTGGAQGFAYTSTPYWGHAIMEWALGTFAGIVNEFVVKRNGAMHESIRKRALRKMEREKKKGL